MAYRQLRFGGHRFDVKGSPALPGLRQVEERAAKVPAESPSSFVEVPDQPVSVMNRGRVLCGTQEPPLVVKGSPTASVGSPTAAQTAPETGTVKVVSPESPSTVRQLPPTGATREASSFPASLVSRLREHLPGLVLLVVFFVLPGLAEWIADVLT
jgi:hypothetical protein